MRTLRLVFVAFTLALVSVGSYAQTSVTATCKDGTTFSGASRRGACARHGGVQAFGAGDAAAPATAGAAAGTGAIANPLAPSSSSPVTPSSPVAPASPAPRQPYTRAAPSAFNAGSGQVWVNATTKIYHCPGTRYYGKTKAGSYMTEAAAKADGNRPNRGKTCSSS